MAKKDVTIEVEDQWLEPETLKLPRGGSIDEALEIVDMSTIDIDFSVVIPKELVGEEEPKFDFRKIPEIKSLRKTLEARVAESLDEVITHRINDKDGDADAFEAAKKVLDSLNSYIERIVGQLRPTVRTSIAKSLETKAKPDQLQTFGRVDFDKFELKSGVFENEIIIESPMLDLDKALKRKKWQQFGVAWKASACVVSVKIKKEFKEAELKELRDALPDGFSQGAKMMAGRFKAESGTKVIFEFPAAGKMPKENILRQAMKDQSGNAVHVTRLRQPPTKPDPKATENTTGTGSVTTSKTGGKTGGPKSTSSKVAAKTSPKVTAPSKKVAAKPPAIKSPPSQKKGG